MKNKEWENAGTEDGLDIWRVEKLNVKRIPKEQHGQFYDGDSYIVLRTKKLSGNEFAWNIHFWLGSQSSIDEITIAGALDVCLSFPNIFMFMRKLLIVTFVISIHL